MTTIDAMVLGVVQGLTEFLPISSSGHLILMRDVLGVGLQGGLAFDAVLHFATACAVVVYFWRDIVGLFNTAWRWVTLQETDSIQSRLLFGIIIATIPAVIFGLFLEDVMETAFRNSGLVAITLLVGAGIMYAAERLGKVIESLGGTPTYGKALAVGFFQSLALIPGMSRSGMAISGGMLLGLTREHATRFAFLLAAPLLLGAGSKKILEIGSGGGEVTLALFIGAISAFFVGVVVIHYLLRFLRTHTLMVFVWYRVALAVLVLVMVL